LSGHHALLLSTQKDNRVFFCIPWGEYSLVGTTDTDFEGEPDHVRAESEDVKYLLEEIQRLFPESKVGPENVISTFAGLRPLVRQSDRSTSQVSREYKIEETFPGLVSILGGKYTTYRSLAEHVVNRVSKILHLHEDRLCQTATLPLPGGEPLQTPEKLAQEFNLDIESSQHLIRAYGARAPQVAKISKEFGIKGTICPHHSYLKSEVLHAFTNEMAQNLEDFLTRRTFIRYSRCRGLDCVETVAKILLELSIFSEEELEEQKAVYREKVGEDLKALEKQES
jgi:glycerol-3-phosphate dehydrogenase